MGGCVSSQKPSKARGGRGGRGGERQADGKEKPPKTTKIIHVDGRVQELEQPFQAMIVTSQNPSCFLCSYESLNIGTCAPHVPAEEELQPGHIYFLMPLSRASHPLSLPDLCALAIKASSAVVTDGFDFSPTETWGHFVREGDLVLRKRKEMKKRQVYIFCGFYSCFHISRDTLSKPVEPRSHFFKGPLPQDVAQRLAP